MGLEKYQRLVLEETTDYRHGYDFVFDHGLTIPYQSPWKVSETQQAVIRAEIGRGIAGALNQSGRFTACFAYNPQTYKVEPQD